MTLVQTRLNSSGINVDIWYDIGDKSWFQSKFLQDIKQEMEKSVGKEILINFYSVKSDEHVKNFGGEKLREIRSLRAPDILITINYEPVIGLEITAENPSGWSIIQRYGVLEICNRLKIPSLLITPLVALRSDGRFRYCRFGAVEASIKLTQETKIPSLVAFYKEYTGFPSKKHEVIFSKFLIDDSFLKRYILEKINLFLNDPKYPYVITANDKILLKKMQSYMKWRGRRRGYETVIEEEDKTRLIIRINPETGWHERGTGQLSPYVGVTLMHKRRLGKDIEIMFPNIASKFWWFEKFSKSSIYAITVMKNAVIIFQDKMTRQDFEEKKMRNLLKKDHKNKSPINHKTIEEILHKNINKIGKFVLCFANPEEFLNGVPAKIEELINENKRKILLPRISRNFWFFKQNKKEWTRISNDMEILYQEDLDKKDFMVICQAYRLLR